LQGGLCNEFDSFSCEIKFLKVHFSVVILFVVVHVTSHQKELL